MKECYKDSKKYHEDISRATNFIKIYKKAIEGYGPAQEAICNKLFLIDSEFYKDVYERTFNGGGMTEEQEYFIGIIVDMVQILVPTDIECARKAEESIDTIDEEEKLINEEVFDLSNEFHKFMVVYMRLLCCFLEKNKKKIQMGWNVLENLAQEGCVVACYSVGAHIIECEKDKRSNSINRAISFLQTAADSGYISAAQLMVDYYNRCDDTLRAHMNMEKYYIDEADILVRGLEVLSAFANWKMYFRSIVLFLFNMGEFSDYVLDESIIDDFSINYD